MPLSPPRPCTVPGCPNVTYGSDGPYCEQHKKIRQKEYDRQRGSRIERGYGARWQRARKMYLARHPFCVECEKEGHLVGATVVDHIVPAKGDYELFWNESNWQVLCEHHHNVKTATEDGRWGTKKEA